MRDGRINAAERRFMKYKVGDRVRVKNCFGGANLKGKIGTVITTKTGSNFYDLGVEFDEPILFGHNCGGLGNEHCCRWGCEIELELIHDNKIVITTDGAKPQKGDL